MFNVDITDYNIRNHHKSWEDNAFKVLMISEDEEKVKEWERNHDMAEVYSNYYFAYYLPIHRGCFILDDYHHK